MNDITGIKESIAIIEKDISVTEKGTEKYYRLLIEKWRACKEYARLTNDEWSFKRYHEPDYDRKISHAELSIDYLYRWGESCE